MIEQAELRAGMTVMEIGSGGYNAVLLAEVVGPDGHVVSVEIDSEVTDRTRMVLEAAGYGGRVTVVQSDAGHGLPGYGTFDGIIVTVGAWGIAPAWLDQLRLDALLVVPLGWAESPGSMSPGAGGSPIAAARAKGPAARILDDVNVNLMFD